MTQDAQKTMNPHKKRLNNLYIRVAAAVLAFVAFLVMNINAALVGAEAHNMGLASIVPLVIAYVSLPKKVPRIVGANIDSDADAAMRLDRLVRCINWLRVGFIVLALFVLLGLPRLVPPAT